MSLSLVTYTYNDHDLVLDLLRTLPGLARPDEIIVVDDCSRSPFPQTAGLKMLRPAKNLGPAGAKRLGIGAAQGDIVLTMDCDIRMDRRWLHNALPLLANPAIALVGASIIPALADNYLSRALHKTAHLSGENHQVSFLPGGIWLFLRPVWEKLGGFSGYDGMTHEDVWFCHQAARAGYLLVAADRYHVYEKRRLHRVQYWRRSAAYLLALLPVTTAEAHGEKLLSPTRIRLSKQDAQAASILRGYLENALGYAQSGGDLAFLYMELVRCVFYLWPSSSDPVDKRANIPAGVLDFFQEYPAISALLREDFTALQLPLPQAAPWPFWDKVFAPVFTSPVLDELETVWMEKMRREDAEKGFDFHWINSGGVL